MKILIACEFSGRVRDAFLRRGHDAISCDLLETEIPGPHVVGDCLALLKQHRYDMLVAFPPCTYLCYSGVRWLQDNPERWRLMEEAAALFNALLNADVPRIAIENSVQHGYARRLIPCYTQIIHPWHHGHGETKATCLWLKGLPMLQPTNIVAGRSQRVYREAPSPDRWKNRSRTYLGIAEAMASQWG